MAVECSISICVVLCHLRLVSIILSIVFELHILVFLQVQQGSTTPQSAVTTPVATNSETVVSPPNVTDANPSEAVVTTPKSTSSSSMPAVFASKDALELFLSTHVKSKGSLARIKAGTGTVNDRRDVTYVVAAKVIDTWGRYPSKERLIAVSSLVACITGLPSELFFEPKSWKGTIMRSIENSRRLLDPKDKRWTWSEAAKGKAGMVGRSPSSKVTLGSADDVEPCSSASPTASDGASRLLEDLSTITGCCRSLEQCELCQGRC
jgi:hypothetical protein